MCNLFLYLLYLYKILFKPKYLYLKIKIYQISIFCACISYFFGDSIHTTTQKNTCVLFFSVFFLYSKYTFTIFFYYFICLFSSFIYICKINYASFLPSLTGGFASAHIKIAPSLPTETTVSLPGAIATLLILPL